MCVCVQTWNGHMKFVRNITKHPKYMAAAAAVYVATTKTYNNNEKRKTKNKINNQLTELWKTVASVVVVVAVIIAN